MSDQTQITLDEFLKQSRLVGFISPPYHETGNKIPSGSITEWKNKTGEWRTGLNKLIPVSCFGCGIDLYKNPEHKINKCVRKSLKI